MSYTKLVLFISLLCISSCVYSKSTVNEAQIHKCEKGSGIAASCPTEFTGTCAYFVQENRFKLNQRYTANGCIACSDSSVRFHKEGKCKGTKVYCDENYRPHICTMEYNPVCAYSTDEEENTVRRTIENECSACSQINVEYYIRGECPSP